jgi:CheY-like chemotaxis protein
MRKPRVAAKVLLWHGPRTTAPRVVERLPHTVVVADDEALFAASVAEALSARFEGMRVLQARDGREALALLEERRVSLLLTDLRMPVMDGLELLAALTARRIRVATVVITAHRSTSDQQLRALGAVSVIEKPVDLEGLLDLVPQLLEERSQGVVQGISLTGFLQLLAMERKTCVVRVVRDAERWGSFAFVDGVLTDARTSQNAGDDAAVEMLGWGEPVLHVEPNLERIQPTVRLPLNHLVMEFARFQDESSRGLDLVETDLDSAFEETDEPDDLTSFVEFHSNAHLGIAPPRTGDIDMSTVTDALTACMKIEGAIAVALVDYESGMTLGSTSARPDFDVELAASGNTQVVRAKMAVMQALGVKGAIEDILITLESQYHIIRPLRSVGSMFLYLSLDRQRGNLGLARHHLTAIEKELRL